MLNDHITEELDRFRQAAGGAFYALQIDAPWGAGKTHFIRSYLDRECGPEEGRGEVGPQPRHVLVSLFGATSVTDLETQVAAQLFTGGARLAGRLTSFLVGAASVYVGAAAQAEAEYHRLRLLSDRLAGLRDRGGIVVFDDVERTRMPLRDALGYINRFVEQDGFKVVLVTNEAALEHDDASESDKANLKDLRLFKEKIVGRTLALSPAPGEAYDAFVGFMAGGTAKRLAAQAREEAIALFHASGRDNLRSVRMGLEAFDRLVPLFEPAWLEKAEAIREVLLGCLFIAIEHAGGTAEEALTNPAKGRFTNLFGRDRDDDSTPVMVDANRIVDTYEDHISLKAPPIPFSTLHVLVAKGRLLTDEVHKGMSESPLVVGEQAAPPWRVLIEIWGLSIEELQQAVERARRQFAELAVTDPGELLHLAGIMLWHADEGDLSLSDGQPVAEFIETYLDRLREGGIALKPSLRPFSREPHFMVYGYGVTGAREGREDLLALADMIRDAVLGGVRRSFPELRERLLVDLAEPNRDLSEIGTEGDMRPAFDLPIFEGWGAEPFANLLMRNGRFDYEAMKWLADGRYGEGQRLEPLAGEADWFEDLCETLRRRIAEAPQPLQNLWRRGLDSLADPALARLRGSQTPPEAAKPALR